MIRMLCLLLLATACRAEGPPRLSDFAYAQAIRLSGDGAIHRLELPEAVYRGVTRGDLGDLRVFNAAGEPVPQALVLSGDERARAVTRYELPLFPLYQGDTADRAGLRVRIEQRGGRHSIRLEQTGGDAGRRLDGYVLDARDLDAPVRRFTLDWDGDADFLVRATLEAGDDLEHWRPVARAATLADLHHLGRHLRRDRIEVAPVKARYFRLRFPGTTTPPALTGVRAEGSHDTRITHYRELPLAVTAGPQPGEYRFELPPGVRAERLVVRLPEVNTLVAADLESRSNGDRPWVRRQQVTLYRLRQDGVELENEDLIPGRIHDRFWRLRVDGSGGGLGAGLPVLAVRQRPHELRFVARGEPPFTLAWGSARPMAATPASANALLRAPGLAPAPAEVTGGVRHIGGEGVLEKAMDWRRWSLWGVLVLGAVLLAWMAWRQFRQMNA